MDLERFYLIKELIEFNLNTTLKNIEINRIGVDIDGEPDIIQINGQYGFVKKYNLEYKYWRLKELQDRGNLSNYFLSVRKSIEKENS